MHCLCCNFGGRCSRIEIDKSKRTLIKYINISFYGTHLHYLHNIKEKRGFRGGGGLQGCCFEIYSYTLLSHLFHFTVT